MSKNNTVTTASNYLLWLIKIGVSAVLFAPIFMNSFFFFPFIVPKNLLFRIAVEIIFAAYVILASINKDYRPKFNKVIWAVLIYFFVVMLSGLVGINFANSLFGNYERMSGLIHSFHLLLYFFVLVNTLKTKEDWYSIFTFSLFISVLMCFIGYAQYLELPFLLKSSGGSRLAATVGNAIYLAVYILFHLFLLGFFFAKNKRFDLKLFVWCFAIFDSLLIISQLLYSANSTVDWGMWNFIKSPLIEKALSASSYSYSASPTLLYSFVVFYILFQIFVLAAWFFREKKYVIPSLLSVIFLFEFFIFYNTQTRGAIVGLICGLIFLGIVGLFLNIKKEVKMIIVACLVFIPLAGLILVANKNSNLVKNNPTLVRLATISFNDITTQSRLVTWQASFKGLVDSPKSFLIGYGPENYYYVFNKYFPTVIFRDNGSQIWFDRAHNIIFDISVASGILGLGAFILILVFSILVLKNNYKVSKSITNSWLFIALIIAYFVQNLFVFDNLNTEVIFYMFLGYFSFLAFTQKNEEEPEPTHQSGPLEINFILISLVMIFTLFGLAFNYKIFHANTGLIKAMMIQPSGYAYDQKKVDAFMGSIYSSPVGQFEARQQLSAYTFEVISEGKSPANSVVGLINLTTSELQKSVDYESKNIRVRLMLANTYNNLAALDKTSPQKAINLLQNWTDLSPTRPQVYFELAQSYALLGNKDKAIEYYQKGITLAPDVVDAHWYLLTYYILSNNVAMADQEIKNMEAIGFKPQITDYQKIITLYDRVKNTNKVGEYFNKLVALEPSLDNYGRLAQYYATIGDNKKAEEVANIIIKLNPATKSQVDTFLEKLRKGELKAK